MKSIAPHKIFHRAACVLAGAVVLLAAGCGGGGDTAPGTIPAIGSSGPGGAGGTPDAKGITMRLELSNTDGSSTTMAHGKPLTVTATVLDKAGKPVPNALLAFSIDPLLVAMSPPLGQIATDANGKAAILLAPVGINSSGATLLTSLAQFNDSSAQAQAAVTVLAPAVTLARITPAAAPAQISAYASTVVTLDAFSNGALLSELPVTISLRSTCATIDRASMPGSVTTLGGRAQFTYKDNGCAQSDTIIASVDHNGATANINLVAASPDATSVELAGIVPADSSIVIQGAGGSGRSETALVRFKVLDKSSLPVSNEHVTFSTISTKAVRLSHASGITDVNGEVVANLISGTEPTSVRVVAALGNGLSTISDTITVTTGLPVQISFSLSAEVFNMEGFDFDDVDNEIKLLLADQFSNPVADGVPVVAQTDSGAIGSSARGGCTTVNGRCTVSLRSQNPRYGNDATAPQQRAGLATMTFTTLAGSTMPLAGQISVFLSTSDVGAYALIDPPAGVTMAGGKVFATTNDCNAVSFDLRVSDRHRNPMPAKTSLQFDSSVKMTGAAYPEDVPSLAPRYTGAVVSGDQGSVHSLALVPDTSVCEPGGPKTISASAILVVKTPLGRTSLLPVFLTYKGKSD